MCVQICDTRLVLELSYSLNCFQQKIFRKPDHCWQVTAAAAAEEEKKREIYSFFWSLMICHSRAFLHYPRGIHCGIVTF